MNDTHQLLRKRFRQVLEDRLPRDLAGKTDYKAKTWEEVRDEVSWVEHQHQHLPSLRCTVVLVPPPLWLTISLSLQPADAGRALEKGC